MVFRILDTTHAYLSLCISTTLYYIDYATAGKFLNLIQKTLTSILPNPAIIIYECLFNLPAEVRLVRNKRWTVSTVLFMANRCILIANAIFTISPYTNKVCLHDLCLRFTPNTLLLYWQS